MDGSPLAQATAVFETDKGNIDVRLAVIDSASSTGGIVPEAGDTLTERYVRGERRGLLNARSGPSEVQNGETSARVEVVTRKGNVRVELVSCRGRVSEQCLIFLQAELETGRQVALHVTSRDGESSLIILASVTDIVISGNVFISLYVQRFSFPPRTDRMSSPETFNGSIQCSTAPSQQVVLLPSLNARIETLHHDRGESLL